MAIIDCQVGTSLGGEFINALWHYLQTLDWASLVQKMTGKSFAITFLYIGFRLTQTLMNRFFESKLHQSWINRSGDTSSQRRMTIMTIIRNGVNYACYFVFGYLLLSLLGFPVSTLLAGAGIAGVAVGLGVKDFIADVVNGFFIILEGQYEVGEEVRIRDVKGTVKTVGIRTTSILSPNGTTYFIPNGDISIVNNLSRENRRILIELPITAMTNLEALAKCIQQETPVIKAKYQEQMTTEPVITGLVRDANGKFSYQISFFVINGTQVGLTGEIYYHYLTALQKADIQVLNAQIVS